jgi:hypothetical protein
MQATHTIKKFLVATFENEKQTSTINFKNKILLT